MESSLPDRKKRGLYAKYTQKALIAKREAEHGVATIRHYAKEYPKLNILQ